MDSSKIGSTARAFRTLTHGRPVEREIVQARLVSQDPTIDVDLLRTWILEALRGEFSAERASVDPQSWRAWARCWLLSSLGRIALGHHEAEKYVRQCTKVEHEPNDWARYWVLESLIVAGTSDIVDISRGISTNDRSPLVRNLALALQAARGDIDARKAILEAIGDKEWTALRALRVVPLEDAVPPLCAMAATRSLDDATYDAIVALGAVNKDWAVAEEAITALLACVKETRRHPWWDGFRRKALQALKNLRAGDAVPILVEELRDSNPAIVYEAAQALESALGVATAVVRVVEAASQTGPEATEQYASALRWMGRDAVADELERLMLTGSDQQQATARALLAEIGGRAAFEKLRARSDAMRQHLEALESTEGKIRELFDSSLLEARSGYKLATTMDAVVFALGVGLIVLSGILVASGRESISALVSGGTGTLAVLYNLFLANPRQRVQAAVEHLMRLKVVFLGYLRQLHQSDQAFVRRFLDDEPLSPAVVSEYSQLVRSTMESAVSQIESRKSPKGDS
jgi:hypothetical protein